MSKEIKNVSYKVVKGDNNTPRVDIDGRLYTSQEISDTVNTWTIIYSGCSYQWLRLMK